jgi:hypothetical protein
MSLNGHPGFIAETYSEPSGIRIVSVAKNNVDCFTFRSTFRDFLKNLEFSSFLF